MGSSTARRRVSCRSTKHVLAQFALAVRPARHDADAQARLVRPYTQPTSARLHRLRRASARVGSGTHTEWTRAGMRTNAKTDGIIEWRHGGAVRVGRGVSSGTTLRPLQPRLQAAQRELPKQPGLVGVGSRALPGRACIPRTNYQRACSIDRYRASSRIWDGIPAAERFRMLYRSFVRLRRRAVSAGGACAAGTATCSTLPLACHRDDSRNSANASGCGHPCRSTSSSRRRVSGTCRTSSSSASRSLTSAPDARTVSCATLRLNCLTSTPIAPVWAERP